MSIFIVVIAIMLVVFGIKYKNQIIKDTLWRKILYYLILIPSILLISILGSYIIGMIFLHLIVYGFSLLW